LTPFGGSQKDFMEEVAFEFNRKKWEKNDILVVWKKDYEQRPESRKVQFILRKQRTVLFG
jgi:hypothetical protein